MIHWDWILTGLIGGGIWYALWALFSMLARVLEKPNRAFIKGMVATHFPTASPIVDEFVDGSQAYPHPGNAVDYIPPQPPHAE